MMKKQKEKSILNKIFVGIVFTILLIYTISLFIPVVWAFLTSLKGYNDYSINMNILGFPTLDPNNFDNSREQFFHLKNYQDFFKVFKFGEGEIPFWSRGEQIVHYRGAVGPFGMLLNTLMLTIGGAFLQTIVPAIMAYALAKFDFKLNKVIFAVSIICMTVPIVGNYPAMLTFLRDSRLYDTMLGYMLMKCNFVGMYFLCFTDFLRRCPTLFQRLLKLTARHTTAFYCL